MVAVRQTVRDAARCLDPARALAQANRLLCRSDPPTCATAILALLDTRRRTVTFANAGHPAPLMTSPGNQPRFLEFQEKDFPLGFDVPLVPALRVVSLPAETLLVFYTDGVTEHERKPLQGELELLSAAMFAYHYSALPSASVIERQMSLTGANLDDVAILTAWTPPGPAIRNTLRRSLSASSLMSSSQIA